MRDQMLTNANSALAMLLGSTANYRMVRPITMKNIGRNYLKYGRGKAYAPNGAQECARRLRQAELA